MKLISRKISSKVIGYDGKIFRWRINNRICILANKIMMKKENTKRTKKRVKK